MVMKAKGLVKCWEARTAENGFMEENVLWISLVAKLSGSLGTGSL
jgi:hypothetical protein